MNASIAYESSPFKRWVPLSGDAATVFYEGSIVTMVKASQDLTQDGVLLIGNAVGIADTTAFKVPYGLVLGFNAMQPTFSSGRQTMTAVASASQHASTAEYLGGSNNVGVIDDGRPKAEVAIIDPGTYIKMPIWNGTWGTAITVGTVSTASTTGAGFTSSTVSDYTPVAGLCTVYCRSGLNKGVSRVTSDTSTTVKTVFDYFKYDIAIGDTFVSVPLREGPSYIQIDATATFIDASASPATNYYIVDVVELNLATAGQEYAIFRFQPDQFSFARA
ncbi:MAG: hypothetical protein PHY29_03110 [Syntrophales bacterium]|nr:hypothetical protein [Syntrophales bacterium]